MRKLKLVASIQYKIIKCECGEVISKNSKKATNICPSCGNIYTAEGVLISHAVRVTQTEQYAMQ